MEITIKDMRKQSEILRDNFRHMTARHFTEALVQSAEIMVTSLLMGYQKTVAPDGTKWERLSPVYTHRPTEEGIIKPPLRPVDANSKPLTNFGTMKNSLTYQLINSSRIYIGYGVPEEAKKALHHQTGGKGILKIQTLSGEIIEHEIKVPARQNIGFSVSKNRLDGYTDIQAIIKVFEEAIVRRLQEL